MGIHEAILNIMRDIGAVGKDKKNVQQGFQFRGVDDAMNATHELFAKHGVFVVPQVIDRVREERTTKSGGAMFSTVCRVKYTFYAADGSSIEAIIDGEGMDTADKSTSKAQAIAFKYALFQVLDIPTEIMPDPDAETPEPSKTAGYQPTKAIETSPPNVTTSAQPAKDVVITKAQLMELVKECTNADKSPNAKEIERLKAVYTNHGYHEAKDILQKDFEQIKKEFIEGALPFNV